MDNEKNKQDQPSRLDVVNESGVSDVNVAKEPAMVAADGTKVPAVVGAEDDAADQNVDASAKMDALNAKMMEMHQDTIESQQKMAEQKIEHENQIRAQRAKLSEPSKSSGPICLTLALLCFLHNAAIAYEVIVPYKNVGGAGDILALIGFPGYVIGVSLFITGATAIAKSKCKNFFMTTLLAINAILMIGTPICVIIFYR